MSGRWHETHVVDPQTELKPAKSLGGCGFSGFLSREQF